MARYDLTTWRDVAEIVRGLVAFWGAFAILAFTLHRLDRP